MTTCSSSASNLLLGLLAAALVGGGAYVLGGQKAATSSGGNPGSMEQMVADYIKNHPEKIIESLNEWQRKEYEKQQQGNSNASESIKKAHEQLVNDSGTPFVGDAAASLTVVEFFDYSCGYCHKAWPELEKLMESRKDVKIVFKELPILGPDSEAAARVALAVHRVDATKYLPVHRAIMGMSGQKNQDALLELVKAQGVDVEKVRTEMAKPEVKKQLDANRDLARQLGINGTPAFIVGNELVPGAVDFNTLQTLLDKAKKGS
jgi:protein-disulfide isomerase